jgi:S1-C subfamily serine protease
MDFTAVIEKVSPSIAKIYALKDDGAVASTGTGFMYTKKGILVTCHHVVVGYNNVVCKFSDDEDAEFYSTKAVMHDTEHDISILKVEVDVEPLPPCKKTADIKAGMPVFFSGYPLNLDVLTTHQGILSAITADTTGVTTYLIDGSVNSGNSGCPLMNEQGEVIGVVNAKRMEQSELLSKVRGMSVGAVSLHGVDLVQIYRALISNVQLGIGYAVPASYIPTHQEIPKKPNNKPGEPKKDAPAKHKGEG